MIKATAREVKVGCWYYDNIKPLTVKIFAINYDYYYELAKADGFLEPDEQPELNENGEMYMIYWGDGDFYDENLVTKDAGGKTLKDAMRKVENAVESEVKWK